MFPINEFRNNHAISKMHETRLGDMMFPSNIHFTKCEILGTQKTYQEYLVFPFNIHNTNTPYFHGTGN